MTEIRYRQVACSLIGLVILLDFTEIAYAAMRFGSSKIPLLIPAFMFTVLGLGLPLLVVVRNITPRKWALLGLLELALGVAAICAAFSPYSLVKLVLVIAMMLAILGWIRSEPVASPPE